MRHVTVVHLLWKSVVKGTELFMLRPHATWTAAGGALLAPLTKKVAGDEVVQQTLEALRREDSPRKAPEALRLRILPPVSLTLHSPAQGVETNYRIVPATARCPAAERRRLAARLGGEWLTRSEALRERALSPTARSVLDLLHATQAGPLSPQALAGDWTERLVYARDCDRRAFGPLFEDMTPHLRGWLRGLLDRPEDIEDSLSDGCLYALANLDTYEPITSPATWLGTIIRHAAISGLRQRGRNVPRSLSGHAEPPEIADEAPSPADAAEEAEELARGRALLEEQKAAMTPVQRLAWRLHAEENMAYREIAATLGVPLPTLGTWAHRVKKALQRAKDR